MTKRKAGGYAGGIVVLALALAGAVWKGPAGLELSARRLSKQDVLPTLTSRLYWSACKLGRWQACADMAWRYERGRGVPKDAGRALAFYADACIGGSLEGCAAIIKKQQQGMPPGGTLPAALVAYRKQCDSGDAMWCSRLAMLYLSGAEMSPNLPAAAQWFSKSCDMGEVQSCGMLAFLLQNGAGIDKDSARAARLFQDACDRRDFSSCVKLGLMLTSGDGGMAVDRARGLTYFERACQGGSGDGCFKQAAIHLTETPEDPPTGRALLVRACDLESSEACEFLGQMYISGLGGPKDVARGVAVDEAACNLGRGQTCATLAVTFTQGSPELGLAVDKARARRFHQKACDYGQDASCEELTKP